MKIDFTYRSRRITITDNHPVTSPGAPVVFVDGVLAEDIPVLYDPPWHDCPSALQQIATEAGVGNIPATRDALDTLAWTIYPDGIRSGAEVDRVIAEFKKR
jgi:hypothetical protein